MKIRALLVALGAGGVGLLSASAAWKIPTPETVSHPAAKEAPASSPLTYPNAEGFKQRADLIMRGLVLNDMTAWRRGFFSGGDPGKYTFGSAMAKLMANPKAEDVLLLMNDERSPKEQYHFAAVNWARFYPIYREALTEKTQKSFTEMAARYAYFGAPGTENHRSMGMTSGNVLPSYLEGGRLSNLDKKGALERGKKDLRAYVKGLYKAGMGEWDSSTYHVFPINGMLNIYDFAEDPETRLIAAAALDWLVAGYALKYRDGVFTAPNQRGFARHSVHKLTDQHGWLWWGSKRQLSEADTQSFHYSMHPVTSSWRPNRVLTHLATKELPVLPFTAQNTKPNYWYGQQQPPQAGEYGETVHVSKLFTMGSLWNGFGSQINRFQIAAQGPDGAIVFTGGSPRKSDHTGKIVEELSYEDGNGRYDQMGQAGAALIHISNMPTEEKAAFSFFTVPTSVGEPIRRGRWWVMQAGETFVAVQGLGSEGLLTEPELDAKQKEARDRDLAKGKNWEGPPRILRFEGQRSGFVVQVADSSQFANLEVFLKALDSVSVEAGDFASLLRARTKNLAGEELLVEYQPGKSAARVTVNGKLRQIDEKAVYQSPYLLQENGVLTVNDGKDGYSIDFTGELPVYRAWKPTP